MTKTIKNDSYHHGDLKNALIKTALEMLENEGVDQITLRELTKRVGASRSAIYRHFSSKKELFEAVIQAGLEQMDQQLQPVLEDETRSLLERFELMGRTYISFAMAHPVLYRLVMGDRLMELREEQCDLKEAYEGTGFGHLVSLVSRAQQEQLLCEGDPILISTTIWAMVHGQASLIIDGHLLVQDQQDAIYRLGFETLIRGLGCPNSQNR